MEHFTNIICKLDYLIFEFYNENILNTNFASEKIKWLVAVCENSILQIQEKDSYKIIVKHLILKNCN